MIKYKEYGLCMTGLIKNNICNISMVTVCEIDYPEMQRNEDTLKSIIKFVLKDKCKRIKMYAHNLNYTGKYIIAQLTDLGLEDVTGKKEKENSFNYIYNAVTGFFRFHINYGNKTIDIIDSKRMAPISISDIAEVLEIEEEDYITLNLKSVCGIVKLLQSEGMTKGTIGGSCLEFYKETLKGFPIWWKQLFPDLTKVKSESEDFKTVDDYLRASYFGGLCYVNPDHQDKIVHNVTTIDRNAMYSSEMHSKSKNRYPYGLPRFTNNINKINALLKMEGYYCFVNLTCISCKIKEKKIPSVRPIEEGFMLTDKNGWLKEVNTDKSKRQYINGKLIKPHFVMTEKDFIRFIEDYDIEGLKIKDCYYFNTVSGIFDKYIDYFQTKKQNAKTKGERQIAKLVLNNITGKFGTRPIIEGYSFNGNTKETEYKTTQTTLHVGIGSAITSYARQNLISTIYKIGFDNFCYCDTDSVHFIGQDTKDVFINDKELGAWKIEGYWNNARFIKQKMYIEEDNGRFEVTWAGLNKDGIRDIEEGLAKGERFIDKVDAKPIKDIIRIATPEGYIFEPRSKQAKEGL